MSSEEIINNCKSKMKKAFDVFSSDLSSLRTGRANATMLDIIKVDVYGQKMSVNQLATISTPEARLLTVQVWDQNNVALIDSAIKKSNLGINPQIDGQLMRIPIPSLTEERRTELKKIMGNLAEKAKISIRNIRREANDKLKKDLKDKKISEDENKGSEKKIQNLTDSQIVELEKKLQEKEKEIITEELKNSGKDPKIVDKIALGKLNKFINDNTLLNQEWVIEPKKKVKEILKEVAGKDKIEIKKFVRFKVGEGI